MKKILLFIALFTLALGSHAQDWSWAIKATGFYQTYNGLDMAVDTEGNMYVAGYFQLDLELGGLSIYTPDDYFADFYIAKINANKEVEWLQMFETDWCYGYETAVAVDDDGNMYVTGNMDGHVFVSKFNTDGEQLWYTDFDGAHEGYGRSIVLDQFDNVYVTGGSGWNFFMAKLNYHGDVVWAKDIWFNYSDAVHIMDMKVDRLGNIYFVGIFDFPLIELDDFILVHDGHNGYDTFWGKMDTDGNFIWIESPEGKASYPQIALTADGHLYIAGSLFTGITIGGIYIDGICCNDPKPYITKYDTDGTMIWVKEGFTTYGEKGITKDLEVNYAGHLYLTGVYFTTSSGLYDVYLEEYNPDGDHLWRKEFNMDTWDFSRSIELDNYGHAYYTGVNKSETFIDENLYSPTVTMGVAQLTTGSSTYKKTPRPKINRLHTHCDLDTEITLTAIGSDIKWYSDPELNNLVHEGNTYTFTTSENLRLYVTQTVNNITSWPKEVIVQLSELDSAELTFEDPILTATYNPIFTYEWYYLDVAIPGATEHFLEITPGTDYMDYGVIIRQHYCQIGLGSVTLSNANVENDLSFTLSPNPTSGIVSISSNTAIDSTTVYTSLGSEVLSVRGTNELDLSSLPSGLYFVRVMDIYGNGVVKRMVKK
jgi:Secretion system C-terminal sorting domain